MSSTPSTFPQPYDPAAVEAKWQAIWEAERAFHAEPPAPRYEQHRGYGEYRHHGHSYKKRKKHFLEELFD